MMTSLFNVNNNLDTNITNNTAYNISQDYTVDIFYNSSLDLHELNDSIPSIPFQQHNLNVTALDIPHPDDLPPLFRIMFAVICMLTLIGGLLVNGYIVMCIILCGELRKKFSNCMLLHLTLSNMLSCLVVAPFNTIALIHPGILKPDKFTCTGIGTASSVLILLSLWTVVAINIDKYKTITSPLKYSTYTSYRRIFVFVTITHSFVILTVLIIHLLGPNYKFSVVKGGCTLDFPDNENKRTVLQYSRNYTSKTSSTEAVNDTAEAVLSAENGDNISAWLASLYNIKNIPCFVMLATTFLLPTLTLIICYSRIFQIARSHRKGIVRLFQQVAIQIQAPIAIAAAASPVGNSSRSDSNSSSVGRLRIRRPSSCVEMYALLGDTKAICSISVILGSFFVCYLPFGGVCMYESLVQRHLDYPHLVMCVSLLFRVTPLVNGLVYGVHNKILSVAVIKYQVCNLCKRRKTSRSEIHFEEEEAVNNGQVNKRTHVAFSIGDDVIEPENESTHV